MSLLGPVVKAAKKLADEWDEAAWLKENPEPPGTKRSNPEKKKWLEKRHYYRNRQKKIDSVKARYEVKAEEIKATERARYQNNRDKLLAGKAEHYQNNKGKVKANVAKKKAAQLERTPSYSNDEAIRRIYEQSGLLSESTGIPHEVDHVIPLQGEKVSGLHVPGNLMIVPDNLNLSKNNAFAPGDDPMRFNDVAQKNITEQNAKGLLEDGFADPRLLAGIAGTTAAGLAAPMIKDSGMISAPRSETLFDLTMGARDVERRLEGSPASLLFPSGLVDYLETVNRREEDPNAMTRGMALLDFL